MVIRRVARVIANKTAAIPNDTATKPEANQAEILGMTCRTITWGRWKAGRSSTRIRSGEIGSASKEAWPVQSPGEAGSGWSAIVSGRPVD